MNPDESYQSRGPQVAQGTHILAEAPAVFVPQALGNTVWVGPGVDDAFAPVGCVTRQDPVTDVGPELMNEQREQALDPCKLSKN